VITAIRFSSDSVSAFGSLMTGGTSAFPRNAVGFMHALERKLQKEGLTLGKNRKVAVGVENYVLHKGEKNYSTPKMSLSRPWKGKGDFSKSVLDYEWKCNAIITLLVFASGAHDTDNLKKSLEIIIPQMRFANGSIFKVSKESPLVTVTAGNDEASIRMAVKSIKAGRTSFITSRDDLIEKGNEFESFADAVSLFKKNGDSEKDKEEEKSSKSEWYRKHPGWIVPLERGYMAVTEPITGRQGSRDLKVPTIVASSVIGLGEYVSAKRFLNDLDLKSFWFSTSNAQSGFYLFSSTSFNG